MAKDMMERMLEGLVDHVFSKVGYTREQVKEHVGNFLKFGKDAHDTMQRIEANQHTLIGAENERRASEGREPLRYASSGDGGDSTGQLSIGGDGG